MKRNILRAAVAASILGISGVAFAASDTVVFTGTIVENCSISAVVNGTIGLVDSPAADGTMMSSDTTVAAADGVPGSFDVTCLAGTAAITIHAPVGSDPTTNLTGEAGYVADARLYDAGASMIASEDTDGAGTATAAAQPAAGGVTYTVNMDVSTTGDIPSGTYSYDVTVDVTSG